MKKVLYVATVVKTHIMEFHIPYLKMLKEMGWETAVASRNDYENPEDCIIPFCDSYYDIPFKRFPFHKGNLKAYKMLKKLIENGEYDVVHCHTPVGAMLARLAARKARKNGTKVFYTAHGFHFFKGAPAVNWLLYYPVERVLSRLTDVLITINKEDFERAKKFHAKKVMYVPGVGISIAKFSVDLSTRALKRQELGVEKEFVVLSVGELIKRKNHVVVLEALAILKEQEKLSGIRYLICGRGEILEELKLQVRQAGLEECVCFLGYRNDISDICAASDLFVFMSLQEGLPVALMEAMACGLPIVCSKIRGNTDLIADGKNGCFAENNAMAVAEAILHMKQSKALCEQYGKSAKEDIWKYDLKNVLEVVKPIYEEV